MEEKIIINEINYGYIPPEIKPEDYILGSGQINPPVINPSADWRQKLPDEEIQIKKFESYNCTSFTITNATEVFFNLLGIKINFSDRELGIVAGTKPPGNNPISVAQTFHKKGLSLEALLPFRTTWKTGRIIFLIKAAVRRSAEKWQRNFYRNMK